MAAKPRVVVLGGGFGGLESAFYYLSKTICSITFAPIAAAWSAS